jgi:hypothetical protein
MTPNDLQEDPVLATLRELRPHDVRRARAERLRTRCHTGLRASPPEPPRQVAQFGGTHAWPQAVRVVAGAWCLIYVLETIRRAAAVYGY